MRSVLPGAEYEIRVLRKQVIRAAMLRLEIRRLPEGAKDIATFGAVSFAFFLIAMVLGSYIQTARPS
jgi:hypothetical protein